MKAIVAEEYEPGTLEKHLVDDVISEEKHEVYRILYRKSERPDYADHWQFTGNYHKPQEVSQNIWMQSQSIIRAVFKDIGIVEVLQRAPKKVRERIEEKINTGTHNGDIPDFSDPEYKNSIDREIWTIIGEMFAQIFHQTAVKFCLRNALHNDSIELRRKEKSREDMEFLDAAQCYENGSNSQNHRVHLLCEYLKQHLTVFMQDEENLQNITHTTIMKLLGLFGERIGRIPEKMIVKSRPRKRKKTPGGNQE